MVASQSNTSPFATAVKPWLIWAIASGFFFFVYMVRISPGVLTAELTQAFNMDATLTGLLMSSFYLPYVSMQIPVGLLIDRFGPQKLLYLMATVASIGTVLFATANSLIPACIYRAIVGASAAFAFVGVIKLAASWHSDNKMALIVGLTQGSAMLGAFCLVPISYLSASFGWRNLMLLLATLLFGVAIAIFLWAKPKQQDGTANTKASYTVMESLRIILKSPQTWFNALLVGLFFMPTAIIAESWGSSFFQHVYGMSKNQASTINAFMFFGWIIGGPLTGWYSDRVGKRKPVILLAHIALLGTLLLVIFTQWLTATWVAVALFMAGVANSGISVAYTLATEIHEKAVSATALAFSNMASVIIGALFLPVVGWILDKIDNVDYINSVPVHSAAAYQWAFTPMLVGLGLGILLLYFIKEPQQK